MKNLSVTRKVDLLGRVVLPQEFRQRLGIEQQDAMRISLHGNQIILEKAIPSCNMCGSTEKLTGYRGRWICSDCISEIQKMERPK